MAYDDDEGWDEEGIALLESDGWDAESRRSRFPRYQRQAARRAPTPAPSRPATAGVRGAVMNTPAGQARVNFEKPVASKEDFDTLTRQVDALRASMRRVDEQLDKNTAILDKKVAAIEAAGRRQGQQGQLGMLLPLLMSSQPEAESISFATVPTAANTAYPATVKFKPGDNTPLLLAMMLGGGMGGGSGSDEGSMMPMMMLAMMGGFGKKA